MKVEAYYKKRKQLSEYVPPAERHKLKVVKTSNVNSPARAVVDKSNENSLAESPLPVTSNPGFESHLGQTKPGGKRRPSDPDSEAEISGDSSRMNCETSNGEAQPPTKRSNTINSNTNTDESSMTNGSNGGLEVS